jgi:Ca-activated chloride channel family protein
MFRRKRLPPYLMIEDNPIYTRTRSRRWPLIIFGLALIGVLYLVFVSQRSWASEAPLKLNEVAAGQLLFDGSSGYDSSVQLSSQVEFQVSGLINHVTLKQSFHNKSREWRQATYVFPLPDKAAVNSMKIQIGERLIVGKVHEKLAAKKIYMAAKKMGKKAALTEQQRPNLFSQRVANIAPNETVTVMLEYIEPVSYRDGLFSLRFPMTLTPRYIPAAMLLELQDADLDIAVSSDGWGLSAVNVSADTTDLIPPFRKVSITAKDKPNSISVNVSLDMGMTLKSVDSLFHPIVLSRKDDKYHLKLADSTVSMDQDFVLQWQPDVGSEPKAALFNETVNGENYVMLMVLPPEQAALSKVLPKDIIYVVDTSGSMGGESIKQARQSLVFALAQLSPADRFNVIEFNSSARQFYPSAVAATPGNISSAKAQVSRLQANGGTHMMAALALALAGDDDNRSLRQIVFITDGSVANEGQLYKYIVANLGTSRLFTVGIGAAPNSWFMRKAAEFGGGSYTHIGSVSAVYSKMAALFSKLNSPVANNISITWPMGFKAEVYPQRIPDLYKGEPLMVVAKVAANAVASSTIKVSGQLAVKDWSRSLTYTTATKNSKGVATLWARGKIAALMDEIISAKAESDVKPKIVAIAVRHQLLSKYTSFVAVEEKVSRPIGETVKSTKVANLLPHGSTMKTHSYPKTATPALLNIASGGVLLMFGLGFLLLVTRRSDDQDLV